MAVIPLDWKVLPERGSKVKKNLKTIIITKTAIEFSPLKGGDLQSVKHFQ